MVIWYTLYRATREECNTADTEHAEQHWGWQTASPPYTFVLALFAMITPPVVLIIFISILFTISKHIK